MNDEGGREGETQTGGRQIRQLLYFTKWVRCVRHNHTHACRKNRKT